VAALGDEHPDVGWTLRDMGLLVYQRGNPEEALPLFEHAVAIHEKALGKHHPDLADILPDYSAVLRELGRTAEADSLDLRVEMIREEMVPTPE